MTLRARLLAFSSAQLIVFGLLCTVGYYIFRARVLPILDESLTNKAESRAAAMTVELDIALAADDRKLIERQMESVQADPDFRYVEVRNQAKVVVFRAGTDVTADLWSGPPHAAHAGGEIVRAWTPVSLEGVELGSIAIVYDTARIDLVRSWVATLGLVALLVWLGVLAYSFRFSRDFVRPIRSMMHFAKRVAGGQVGETLDTKSTGELADLARSLDQMSIALAERDQERKRASAKEAELQRELMSVSRMAGMAEVATGVLHNVGNVLNSLNVSVSVVGDRLRQSKIASLTRTVEMFSAHPEGLPGVLATEKGKLLPQFLASVAARLADENAQLRKEIASVSANVDHIKVIVATQQSYAQVAGVSEPVELRQLIDDALHMSEAAFARHKVELVRHYDELPTLNTDRHKLLQIVVNVVSNARQALKAQGAGKLTVELRKRGDNIAIIITDTGIGIPSENLKRVFQHGFTTKKGGHGFGLHSCANAARELGGSIAVTSAGTGCGATFTIEIPIHSSAKGIAVAA